jgi:hypothetical protein
MNTQRPLPVTIAIVLLVILNLGNLLTPVISEGAPASAIYLLLVLGVLGLVGAAGLWAEAKRSSAPPSRSGCSPTSQPQDPTRRPRSFLRSQTASGRSSTSSRMGIPTLRSPGNSI